jgi:transmembrane sensor
LGGAYFLHFNKSKPGIVKTQVTQDLPPGGNKAVLTLGNGRQIILDSTQNGIIAMQGNTKILKTDGGKLAYTSTKEIPTEITYNVLTTPRGGQFQLSLPDGTKVWLNAASSIKYPTAFVGKERDVEMTGEAYFEVKHNAEKPFRVKAGDKIIEDLGTAFNVNAYTDESALNTTLISGSIRMENRVLKQGQQMQINNTGGIKIIDNADFEEVLAWKNGLFEFDRQDMQSIMRQVARWYDVEVSYEGEIASRSFSGIVSRNSNLSQVMKIMESANIRFRLEDKKIIITQ